MREAMLSLGLLLCLFSYAAYEKMRWDEWVAELNRRRSAKRWRRVGRGWVPGLALAIGAIGRTAVEVALQFQESMDAISAVLSKVNRPMITLRDPTMEGDE